MICNPRGFTFHYIPSHVLLGCTMGLHFFFSYTLLPFLIQWALANIPDWVISEPCPCSPRIRSREAWQAGLFPRIQPRPFLNSLSGSPPFIPPRPSDEGVGGGGVCATRRRVIREEKRRNHHPLAPVGRRLASAGSVGNLLRAVGKTWAAAMRNCLGRNGLVYK